MHKKLKDEINKLLQLLEIEVIILYLLFPVGYI